MGGTHEWDVEIYVVQDSDGTVIGHSQSTDAYRIYGEHPDLAYKVAEAQGINYDNDPNGAVDHFRNTALAREQLEKQLQERGIK